jgi:hypothetical protein
MFLQPQAVLQHIHVHEGGQHADHQVVLGDEGCPGIGIGGIQ